MKRNKDRKNRFQPKIFFIDSLIVISMTILLMLILEGFLRLFFPQTLEGKKIEGESFSNFDKSIKKAVFG